MRLVATALRKQHWGGCSAGQAKGIPGPAGVLGAGELHYPWECVAARIMTKNMQFGIGFPVRSTLSYTAWKRGRIPKYWKGSVLASTDASADSVSLQRPPASLSSELIHPLSSTLLASQDKEEKIAVEMASESISEAASTLAER